MTLNKEQLLAIKSFIEKRGIIYLDVQMEILDHVASSIEEKITTNPSLNFEEVLKQTHLSFGVLGFSVIETGIVNALSKRYNRFFWKNFLSFFGLKYIPIVFFGIFLIYQTQLRVTDRLEFLCVIIFVLIVVAFFRSILSIRNRAFKKLMSYRISSTYTPLGGVALIYINNYLSSTEISSPVAGLNLSYLVVSLLLTVFIIYCIAAIKTSFKGIKESKSLMEKYKILYS